MPVRRYHLYPCQISPETNRSVSSRQRLVLRTTSTTIIAKLQPEGQSSFRAPSYSLTFSGARYTHRYINQAPSGPGKTNHKHVLHLRPTCTQIKSRLPRRVSFRDSAIRTKKAKQLQSPLTGDSATKDRETLQRRDSEGLAHIHPSRFPQNSALKDIAPSGLRLNL